MGGIWSNASLTIACLQPRGIALSPVGQFSLTQPGTTSSKQRYSFDVNEGRAKAGYSGGRETAWHDEFGRVSETDS